MHSVVPIATKQSSPFSKGKGGWIASLGAKLARAILSRVRNDGSGYVVSIHHDLHAVAHFDLRAGIETVEHAEALRGMIDAGHAV